MLDGVELTSLFPLHTFAVDSETTSANLHSATRLAVMLGWVAGAVAVAYLLGWAVSWLLRRFGRDRGIVHDLATFTRHPFHATLMLIAANIAVAATVDGESPWRPRIDHVLHILIIAAITWLVASLVMVAERRTVARFTVVDDQFTGGHRRKRRIQTQVMTLRRLAIVIIVVLGAAAALMTFPGFTQIGTTLFASAGVLSVVAGLAAQTSLGSVFAGMQISFSDAIRVGDIVVVEGEYGRIDEITLTYVVVEIWDQRRLVLPTTYFTTNPFENWTRNATELLGTVELDVDFTVPVDEMRAELDRLLAASDLWDGRASSLRVTNAVGGFLRVRPMVSAADADALFVLRCDVREGLIDWLQRNHPGALPRYRVQESEADEWSELVGADAGRSGGDGHRR